MVCKRHVWGLLIVASCVMYITLFMYYTFENPHAAYNYVLYRGLVPTYNTSDRLSTSVIHNLTRTTTSYDVNQPRLQEVQSTIQLFSYPINTVDGAIAVGGGIKFAPCPESNSSFELNPLISQFYPSFCSTISPGFTYYLYFAYDYDDKCLSIDKHRHNLIKHITHLTNRLCPHNATIHPPRFIRHPHHGKPAWAQNDAMMAAYWDNITYFYRINDDTRLESRGWTERFIAQLREMDPPQLGVVGPHHKGGNINILTYDFVHRTHVDILGYYYPNCFPDWYADDWITYTYNFFGHMEKVNDVLLVHTTEFGRRYKAKLWREGLKRLVIDMSVDVIQDWMSHNVTIHAHSSNLRSKNNVVSFALHLLTEHEYYGALRNLILVRTLLPSHWSARIYLPLCTNTNLVKRLEDFGATIIFVTSSQLATKCVNSAPTNAPVIQITEDALPDSWAYLVLQDTKVDYVLVRNATQRITTHEAKLIIEWELSNKTVHMISYLSGNSSCCLVGGKRTALKRSLMRTPQQTVSHQCTILKDSTHNSDNLLVHRVLFSNTTSINIGEVVSVHEVQLFRDVLNETKFEQEFHENETAKKNREKLKKIIIVIKIILLCAFVLLICC